MEAFDGKGTYIEPLSVSIIPVDLYGRKKTAAERCIDRSYKTVCRSFRMTRHVGSAHLNLTLSRCVQGPTVVITQPDAAINRLERGFVGSTVVLLDEKRSPCRKYRITNNEKEYSINASIPVGLRGRSGVRPAAAGGVLRKGHVPQGLRQRVGSELRPSEGPRGFMDMLRQ